MTSRIDNFPPLLIVGHRYAGSSRYHIIEEREDIQGGRVPGGVRTVSGLQKVEGDAADSCSSLNICSSTSQ